ARCLLNSIHPESWWKEADGVHFRATDAVARARALSARLSGGDIQSIEQHRTAHASTPPSIQGAGNAATATAPQGADCRDGRLIGASAHDNQDLNAARALDADFVVLGHVLDTPSHLGLPGMGWPGFATLA